MAAKRISRGPPIPARSPTRNGRTFSTSAPIRKGVLAERWRHAFGCGRFFNCLRDTVSDKILATYKAGEPRPDARGRTRRAARMSQPFRVAGVGSIDRSRPLAFTFDGLAYQGYAGDTLASALIANGVHLSGARSNIIGRAGS